MSDAPRLRAKIFGEISQLLMDRQDTARDATERIHDYVLKWTKTKEGLSLATLCAYEAGVDDGKNAR